MIHQVAMEFHPVSGASSSVSFAGDTLILPVVSHGNVGQLATDLLVASLAGSSRVGCLDHPALLPCVGRDAFGDDAGPGGGHIALSMEVYRVNDDDAPGVVLAQQRAEVALGSQRTFAADTARWARESGFKEVIVLASAPSTDANAPGQIGGTSFRHVTASGAPDDRCVAANIPHHNQTNEIANEKATPPWSLVKALRDAGVTGTALIATCSEGDNTEDAKAMAEAVARVIHGGDGAENSPLRSNDGNDSKWTTPPSWAAAYGQQPIASQLFM